MNKQEARQKEMEERIEQVGEYFLETGKSTREISKYFTDNFFPISNKTVSEYIHKYQKLKPSHQKEILEKIDINREKDYTEEEIQKQILIELDLLFKGYTINEIAQIFDKSFSAVQRDLTVRLEKLCKLDPTYNEFYLKTQQKLSENQTLTIEENRKQWK